MLSGPDEAIIDWYHIAIPNKVDHSRGRVTDGAIEWGVMTNPTPGASNTGVFDSYAALPTFCLAAGFYTGAHTIESFTNGPGLPPYYTINGQEPTNGSTVYTGPIPVSTTTVLKTVSYSDDPSILPSFYETNTYFIDVSHDNMYTMSISGDQIETLLNGTQIEPVGTFELFASTGAFITEVDITIIPYVVDESVIHIFLCFFYNVFVDN